MTGHALLAAAAVVFAAGAVLAGVATRWDDRRYYTRQVIAQAEDLCRAAADDPYHLTEED